MIPSDLNHLLTPPAEGGGFNTGTFRGQTHPDREGECANACVLPHVCASLRVRVSPVHTSLHTCARVPTYTCTRMRSPVAGRQQRPAGGRAGGPEAKGGQASPPQSGPWGEGRWCSEASAGFSRTVLPPSGTAAAGRPAGRDVSPPKPERPRGAGTRRGAWGRKAGRSPEDAPYPQATAVRGSCCLLRSEGGPGAVGFWRPHGASWGTDPPPAAPGTARLEPAL